MKGSTIVIGLGVLVAGGAVAYAMARGTKLEHGGVYTWVDSRGFPAADTKAQYESLGFASVSIMQADSGWAIQAIWTGVDTDWDVPAGLTNPVLVGEVG